MTDFKDLPKNKLPCYQGLPSVEHILFIESRFPAVTLFSKNGTRWDKAFFNEKNEAAVLRGHVVSLEQIYRKTEYFPA